MNLNELIKYQESKIKKYKKANCTEKSIRPEKLILIELKSLLQIAVINPQQLEF